MRPAIQRLYDPNQGVRDQAGAQVRQERELAALSDRAMGGYSGYADRNQVEEFGRGAMEMTGAPAWARGIQDVQNGRPGEAIPEFLWGALNTAGIATLPLGGGARPATPPRVPRDLPSRLRVYHGSPHQFDQFDAARIGSGEGAQAYGHGLYVAEADDVGQAYRQQLSGPDGGYLYEGYLSGRPSEFIDLDAPVANQPRRVQEFISELYELPIAELRRRRLRPVIVGEAEAQRAQQAGFAGLRYLDEGSRASGRGTRNYVVFDPNRVEWDIRNGALTRPPPNAANAYRVSEGSSSPANTVIAEPQLPPQVRSGPNAQALPEPMPSAVRPQRPPATASPDAGSFEAGLHLRQDDAGNWFVADRTGERQSEHIFGDEIGARAALSNMRSGLPEMGEIRMLPDGDFGGRAPTQLLPDGGASGAGNVATPLYDAFGNQVNMGLPPLPEMGPIALPEPMPRAVRPQRPPATASPDAGQSGAGQTLYHGTGADIQGALRPTENHPRGTAVYLTPDLEMARSYAESAPGGRPNVISMQVRGRIASEDQWHLAYQEANPPGAPGSNIDRTNRAVSLLQERGFVGVRDGLEVAVWNPDNLVRNAPDGGASGAGNVATPLYDAFGNQVNMGLPPLPEMGPILPELGANDRGAIERAAALLRGENTSREATYPLGVRRVFDNHGPASEGFRRIEATREQQFDFDPQNIERRRNPWPEPRLAVDNPAPDAPNAGPSRPPPRPRPPPRRPQQ